MGTKVEHGFDVLAASTKSSSFSVHTSVDESSDYYKSQSQGLKNIHSFQITGLDKYSKMPEKHNIDFIRNTMQIHEDIFKQQVRELHRVYSVQKMLMEEMKNNNKKNKNYRNMDNYDYRLKLESNMKEDEMSPRESCSGDHHNHNHNQTLMKKIKTGSSSVVNIGRGFDLETFNVNVADQENHQDGHVISRNEDDDHNEDEIELTLSIGGSGRRKKLNLKLKNEELLQESTTSTTISTTTSSTTPTFDQQRKHPHWLFQGLGINRTSSSTG